jgi:hypothetical protein
MNRIPMSHEISVVTPADIERQRRVEQARAAKLIEDRKRREQERERARIDAEREAGREALEAYEAEVRASVLASGGSEADFSRLWPDLKARYLAEKAAERMTARKRRVAEIADRMKAAGGVPRL